VLLSKHVTIRILSTPFQGIPEEKENEFNPATGWYDTLVYTGVNVGSVAVVESEDSVVVAALIDKFSASTPGVPTVNEIPFIVPGK
jgi:hypothetical protein